MDYTGQWVWCDLCASYAGFDGEPRRVVNQMHDRMSPLGEWEPSWGELPCFTILLLSCGHSLVAEDGVVVADVEDDHEAAA